MKIVRLLHRIGLATLSLPLLALGPSLLAEEPPSFGTGTQVVLLDLVVRDAKGHPVTDLRREEVEVSEDGVRCPIVSFRLVEAGPPAVTTPGGAPPTAASGEAATPARPSLVVLAFDSLASDGARRAQRAALDLLARPFPRDTWFAVFKTGPGLRVVRPFTADPGALTPAVRAATTGADAPRDAAMGLESGPASDSLTEQAARDRSAAGEGSQAVPHPAAGGMSGPEPGRIPPGVLDFVDRARRTQLGYGSLTSLLAIVKGLATVDGRKAIVYFSEGLHVTTDAEGLFDAVVGEANRARVTVYAVDARGLTVGNPRLDAGAALDAAGSGAGSPPPSGLNESVSDALRDVQGNLARIAEETGGLLLANTERLGPALGRVAAELGRYYEVGYSPPNPAPDGTFRRIQAKVSRRGLTVRTRSGYYAMPAASPSLSAEELPLLAALEAKEPRRDFPHEAAALHFESRGLERSAVLLVEVPLAGVRLTPDESRQIYRARLTLLAMVEDETGRLVARLAHDWPLEGPLAEIEARRQGRAEFRHALLLRPGRYTLLSAVHDREADRLSVARTAIDVPAAGSGVGMSSAVIVRRTDTAPPDATAPDPLRVGRVSIRPSVGPVTTAATSPELVYFVTVYPAADGGPPEVRLELRRGGEVKAFARPSLPPADADRRIPYVGRVPLERLPPGPYELVLSARQGASAVEERASFEIPPPPPPATPPAAASAPVAAAGPASAPADPDLAALLEWAGEYVLEYEADFRVLVAEESCTQSVSQRREAIGGPGWDDGPQPSGEQGHRVRRTRADLVFARLPGVLSWGSFRDVYEVDGVKVRDRDARLERLFRDDPTTAVERARAIVRENARYNIGSERTINIPTLPLLFLHPRNRSRFEFERAGRRRVAGVDAVEVRFLETARPTLVREGGAGGDLPAQGSFWVDPTRGTVVRTDTRFRFGADRGIGEVRTEYRREPTLRMWVPSEMEERYEDWSNGSLRSFTGSIARYSNFRQFTVTVEDEKAALPPPPQPDP